MSGKCFTCKPGIDCAVMGYHADSSMGLENEVQPQTKLKDIIGNKYYLTTGKEYPFCRKLTNLSVIN